MHHKYMSKKKRERETDEPPFRGELTCVALVINALLFNHNMCGMTLTDTSLCGKSARARKCTHTLHHTYTTQHCNRPLQDGRGIRSS